MVPGTMLCEFPVNPRLGKVLYKSLELGCTEEVLTVASMLCVQNPFVKQGGQSISLLCVVYNY